MLKFPFTPAGVAAMCQHFYQLPDAALQDAAAALANNFPLWVNDTFELAKSQIDYLKSLALPVQSFMAANASLALGNRLPIILFKPDEASITTRQSKLTRPEAKLTAKALPDGSYTAEGEFVIEITY